MQLSSAFSGSKTVLKAAPAPHVNPKAPRQVTCMAKKKGVRCIVTLECTEARGLGQTPSRYTTQKVIQTAFAVSYVSGPSFCLGCQLLTQVHSLQNRKNTTGRMELKKYNKHLKRVTVHKEIK